MNIFLYFKTLISYGQWQIGKAKTEILIRLSEQSLEFVSFLIEASTLHNLLQFDLQQKDKSIKTIGEQ
jgi:hypothetical protein